LPEPRAIEYFREGRLAERLLDEDAEEAAQSLHDLSPTQLRRFYEDVLTLRERLRVASGSCQDEPRREAEFQRLRAEFKMLKAKAAYARGRNPNTFPLQFLQFFIDHVAAVNSARDFEAFCKHFQAVVAFHKFYESTKASRD
jgi:CRISPR-associated protein Csm2